jgi:hypothetical protein
VKSFNRRAAIIGAGAAAALSGFTEARAQQGVTHPSNKGGVQQKRLGEGKSNIPGYKSVLVVELVVQPGATYSGKMTAPMICQVMQGSLEVTQDQGGGTFTADKDHVWTCNTSQTENGINKGNTVAIKRSVILMA